ncbi:MAG: malto-oligosyltrehalose synthase [Acidobacteria bacterium]|nr:malto-oligosyltrehalose synthase [Acidobacteriota bacterium]
MPVSADLRTETGISECLDRLAAHKHENRPLATYRLQFNQQFTFQQARQLIPYLKALGISHCYASPLLKSREGSQHGYDIIDHNQLNPEIGSEEDFHAFAAELKAAGIGLVLDVVPNHMGVGQGSNPWWQDVLENGRSSPHADFFDVDWEPLREDVQGKVLLPILGNPYGEELEQGRFKTGYEEGAFHVFYYDKRLPLDPQTYPLILESTSDFPQRPARAGGGLDPDLQELEALMRAFAALPRHSADDPEDKKRRRLEVPQWKQRLASLTRRSAPARAVVQRALEAIAGRAGNSRSFDALHRLLEAQAYRVAYWRVSAEEINYRRFFDINDLIGLRMENPEVFAATHRLIRRLLAENCVTGLRVDHPDGLLNPVQYFTRLQMLYAASQCAGPEPLGATAVNGIEREVQQVWADHDWLVDGPPMFVAVEKILEPGEDLPADWPVDGTVGYEFCNLVNGVFIDARNHRTFTTLYQRLTGIRADIDTIIYRSKKLIMDSAMAGEVRVLTHLLQEISSTDRRARDFTRKALADAIGETIACFPVYRTYIDERGTLSERDRLYIHAALARARRRNESTPAAIFDFLGSVLLLTPDSKNTIEGRRRRLCFTLKFQQLTGPVMAKGLEDTACYVYNRFVSVNEVGGSPGHFGVSVDDFHKANMERLRLWPFSMLCTSTHDSKRSEDVRARLNVLSELPKEWAQTVLRWRRINRSRKRTISDGRAVPDGNEEYLLYQTLAGVWPSDHARREDAARRVKEYMIKAVHEAKVNLSWVNQNPEYIAALEEFIARVLAPGSPARPNAFLEQLESFIEPVVFFGAINSLAQTLLKLTAPGIPDFYQGTEFWDYSLVDPDNRRPVQFAARQAKLEQLQRDGSSQPPRELAARLLELWRANPDDAGIKMFVIMRALAFRHANQGLFRRGAYIPLFATGAAAEHVCAFLRELTIGSRRSAAIVVVPRLACTLLQKKKAPPLGDAWGDTEITLPPRSPNEFQNVFTGEALRANANRGLACREVFATFPVALLKSI